MSKKKQGKSEEAKKEFAEAIRADSSDTDARAQYEMLTRPLDQ